MEIIMKSEKLVVSRIIDKTRAKFFKDLKRGDVIEFSVPLKAAGSNKGTYATDVKVYCYRTNDYTHKTFNQMANVLLNFDFEEFDESKFDTLTKTV